MLFWPRRTILEGASNGSNVVAQITSTQQQVSSLQQQDMIFQQNTTQTLSDITNTLQQIQQQQRINYAY